jgi:hypothetical protein
MNLRSLLGPWVATVMVTVALVGYFSPSAQVVGSVSGVLVNALLALVCVGGVSILERRLGGPLVQSFLVALIARWLVCVLVQYFVYDPATLGRAGLFAPDELQYDYEARLYAQYLAGLGPNPFFGDGPRTGVAQFAARVYVVFGPSLITCKLFMCLLGAWTAVFVALLGAEVSPQVGRRAGLFAALFPSLVLWTSLLLKDGFALFGALLVLSVVALVRAGRVSLVWLALVPAGLGTIAASRPYEMAFVVAALVGGVIMARQRSGGFVRNLAFFVILSLLVTVIMQRFFSQPLDIVEDESPLARVASIRAGMAQGAGSAVRHDIVDVRTPAGLVLWIPIGLFYFFFAPLPFSGGTVISLATSPEMLYWYWLLPSVVRGLRRGITLRWDVIVPLLLYAIVSSIGWSILVTNVGTIYRFRAQMLFVPLLFAAIDHAARRGELTAGLRTEGVAPAGGSTVT